jgi:hypothetical protein
MKFLYLSLSILCLLYEYVHTLACEENDITVEFTQCGYDNRRKRKYIFYMPF